MRVLVDTTVWSLALRRRAGVLNEEQALLRQELTDLIADDRVGGAATPAPASTE